MNPSFKAKVRYYSYYAALIIVAAFAIYGFVLKKQNPEPEKKNVEMVLSTETSLEIKEGDSINIDFDGYVDGEEIPDGSTKGQGLDVTIGAGKLIGNMEEELVGHHPGDTFTMTMVFDDNYKNKDLRGKEATLDMTVNGVYVEKEEE